MENATILTLHAHVNAAAKSKFVDWQSKLNTAIAGFPGFVSLEILSPNSSAQANKWIIVQRFYDPASVDIWSKSSQYKMLKEELRSFLVEAEDSLQEALSDAEGLKGGITEIFVTQVSPSKEAAFREWLSKIHQVEAKFPGFRGMYVQSPNQTQGNNWITLLQFDTQQNLDRWLSSPERKAVLKEADSLIASLDSHRVISPFAGWFSSFAEKGEMPPVWKQTMLILLVLFPIVMLEFKFLNPWTESLNVSLATFIGNAISVSLVSWPLMPIAIRSLRWWLAPLHSQRLRINVLGTLLVALLYLIEIALFWNLL